MIHCLLGGVCSITLFSVMNAVTTQGLSHWKRMHALLDAEERNQIHACVVIFLRAVFENALRAFRALLLVGSSCVVAHTSTMDARQTPLQKRAAARKGRITITKHQGFEPPERDATTAAMTMGERIALACELSRMAYGFKEAFSGTGGSKPAPRLPRHAWPVRLVQSGVPAGGRTGARRAR
jgi:hypothetical protein